MKTYTKDCIRCGVVFEAKHHNIKLCSEECKKANKKEAQARYDSHRCERDKEKRYAANREYHKANRAAISQRAWENQQGFCATLKEEARDLKPILDRLTFTPENTDRIERMVEYIEFEPRLARMLDWYWLSDAKEYLDEQ
jgi:hypothetical protein